MDTMSNRSKEFFSYIKNTVISLGSSLNGSPLSGSYDIKYHVASCGPDLWWRIFQATKKSTKEEASVFMLEKAQLNGYPKEQRDSLLRLFRDGVYQLTRLKHPCLLTVHHPLEENKDFLAFATEPVLASLANVLRNKKNFPYPAHPSFLEYKLNDVDIKYGFLQILEALAFLHCNVKMVHMNVSPENIIINADGFWKLSGFEYSVFAKNPKEEPVEYPFSEVETKVMPLMHPNLDYLSSDYILERKCLPAGDVFSLGLVLFTVYKNGRKLISSKNSINQWKENISKLQCLPEQAFLDIPFEASSLIKSMINLRSNERPDAFLVSSSEFFNDHCVKTLQFLDNIYQRDNIQKCHFYKDLLEIIPRLPRRISLYKVLPCLAKENSNPEMVPFVLPGMLLIAQELPASQFMELIFPKFMSLLKMREPNEVMVIFLSNIDLLLTKCTPESLIGHVMPLVYSSLESGIQDTEDLVLDIIPRCAPYLDYSTTRNALLPRIKALCLRTTFLSVRVNCLVCIGKLLEHLDKWAVLDDVLPFLPKIPSKEPGVLMATLGVVKLALEHRRLGVPPEMLASNLIPFLMPLALARGLNELQLEALLNLIKDMVRRVEDSQREKLKRLPPKTALDDLNDLIG